MLHRRLLILACTLAPCVALAGPQLKIKPGLWEMTIDHQSQGRPPIPQEVLDKMPPEQRARFEATMKKHQDAGPKHDAYKECITQKDLDRPMFGKEQEENCTHEIVKATATHMEMKFQCTEEGQTRSGTTSYDAPDSEHVSGATVVHAAAGERAMTVNVHFAGKWLGADCGDVKPHTRAK
jgi:hypothetical protein